MADQNKDEKLKLYSNKICPFGYRAWLTVEAKKIPYEFIHCPLREKPDFFTEAYKKALGADPSSDGKVPIICDKGQYLTESFIIARYLESTYGKQYGPSLFPDDAMQRASVELMIDWFNNSGWIRNHYGLLMQCNPTKADEQAKEFKEKNFKPLNEKLSMYQKEGTFLPNGQLSMFDVLIYPFFERLCTIQYFAKYDIMGEWMKEFPRVSSWYNTLKEMEPIKTMAQGDQFFIDGYKSYRERGQKRYDEELAAAAKGDEQKEESKAKRVYAPKGKIVTVKSNENDKDLEIYVVGKSSSGKAICAFYDVFGFHNNAADDALECAIPKSNNTKEFYDKVSEIGDYVVIVPNYLRETPLTRKPDWSKFQEWWDSVGNIDKLLAEFNGTVVPYIQKEYKVEQIALIGQCWGGHAAITLGATDAVKGVVSLHGAKVDEKLISALKQPIYYVQTEGDFDFKKAEEAVAKNEAVAKLSKFEKSDQMHGFTASGAQYGDDEWTEKNVKPVIDNIAAFMKSVLV